jgi:hypothetical protein
MPHDLYGASPDGVDPQGAYARFTSMVDPNAPKEEMEAAITEAYGHVPGFEEAYKESVKIDGRWYDLVGAYGSPKASFHGMMLKELGRSDEWRAVVHGLRSAWWSLPSCIGVEGGVCPARRRAHERPGLGRAGDGSGVSSHSGPRPSVSEGRAA